MKFWDSSGLLPLLVTEPTTAALTGVYRKDPALLVWWGAEIECVSAVSRMERKGVLTHDAADSALGRLDGLREDWKEVEPLESVRRTARRLLRVHDLRGPDALQLGAAVVASEGRPFAMEMICLDHRLADAARREGFVVTDLRAG